MVLQLLVFYDMPHNIQSLSTFYIIVEVKWQVLVLNVRGRSLVVVRIMSSGPGQEYQISATWLVLPITPHCDFAYTFLFQCGAIESK